MNLWSTITFILMIVGLIISVKAIIEIGKIQKKIREMKEDELVTEDIMAKIVRKMRLMTVGMFFISISSLIIIFVR